MSLCVIWPSPGAGLGSILSSSSLGYDLSASTFPHHFGKRLPLLPADLTVFHVFGFRCVLFSVFSHGVLSQQQKSNYYCLRVENGIIKVISTGGTLKNHLLKAVHHNS